MRRQKAENMNDQTNDAAGQGEQAECHHCNDLESLRAELAQLKSRDGDTQNRLNELLDTVQKLEAGRDQLKEQLLNNALMAEQQAKELRAQLAMAEDAAKKGDLARQNAAGMEMEIGEFMAQLEGYREILKSVTAMDDWNLPDAKFRQAVMDNWNDLESDNTDLAKQNEALRKALREIAEHQTFSTSGFGMRDIARQALDRGEGEKREDVR